MQLRDLLTQFVVAREELERYGIRDSGDYAEVLVAKALRGSRNSSGVERGFDLLTPEYGRVEVRSRILPRDGRRETRIRVEEKKWNHFAWLAGVIFEPSLSVHAAYLLPHDAAQSLALGAYPRFPLEAALAHPDCVNITAPLKEAEEAI